MDRVSWEFDYDFPKIVEPEKYAAYTPLTCYILRKIFGDSGLFKARTFKEMTKLLNTTFPAVGDIPATPYISRATIAYVHSLILHTPYYNRDDKLIKGKIEDYYQRELEGLEEIPDEDFQSGLHAMFKHHFNWIVKDVGAGYDPDADMYVDPPSREPTPPATPSLQSTPPRARAKTKPQAAPGGAEEAALAGPAEGEGDAVDEPVGKGLGKGRKGAAKGSKGEGGKGE